MLRDFELSSSRALLFIYLLLFLLAAIVWGLISISSLTCFMGLSVLALIFVHRILRDALQLFGGSCVRFHLGEKQEIRLDFRDGSSEQMKAHPSSFVLPYVIVLNTYQSGLAGWYSLIILPSMVGGEEKHRQLRIWLRWKLG